MPDADLQLKGTPNTINDRWFDSLVRHQVFLLRVAGSIRNDSIITLDGTEPALAGLLLTQLDIDSRRNVDRIIRDVARIRMPAWNIISRQWDKDFKTLSVTEADFLSDTLKRVVPVIIAPKMPTTNRLTSLVETNTFQGLTLQGWADRTARADIERIQQQVRIGVQNGETNRQITNRVIGTVARRGDDGVTKIARDNIQSVTRTATIATSNAARTEFLLANSDIFDEELYVATLDSRTTPICRSLDGDTFPVGVGPQPPLHFNCRSLRVATINGEVIGDRPAKPFAQRQFVREYVRDNNLDSRITQRRSLPFGHKGRFDAFERERIRALTGRVPAKLSYSEWLKRQPASVQDDILGPSRGALFRRGGLTLDRFVNRAGDEIPLNDLMRRHREAFEAAGLL